MTAAEKRAALEAAGETWPDCDCHDEPMSWNARSDLTAGGRFRCRIRLASLQQQRRQRLKRSGVCVHCGGPLETETRCKPCAEAHRKVLWLHEQTPKRRLDKYLDNMRRRQLRRADEGFRPTGVGLAAFAAWTKEGLD